MTTPAVSVILCTYNRAPLLPQAIEALVAQAGGVAYEVVVVDNHSTDGTRAVVEAFAPTGRVRYLYEPRQGLSYARNTGIRAAGAAILAFTDDDVRVDAAWVERIRAAFAGDPTLDFVGGRVMPIWTEPPPGWLRAAGLAPLALVDYGNAPLPIDPGDPLCLVGANLAIRRRALEKVGLFSTELQRVRDGIGSTEDHELELRLLANGCIGRYDPSLVVRAEVPAHRLRRRYHRSWHAGHGRYYARMRDPRFERSRRRVLGVPGHVFRAALRELGGWLRDLLRRRPAAAFGHELRLRFLLGFARQRILDHRHA